MKIIPLITLFLTCFTFGSYAQDNLIKDYNKFSVEANVGLNSPSDLFTPGAYTADPNQYINFTILEIIYNGNYWQISYGKKFA